MFVITVARKPMEGTVARNAMKWGTGGLNIDKTRIAHGADVDMDAVQRQGAQSEVYLGGAKPGDVIAMYKPGGRWPANMVLGAEAAVALDEQSGLVPTGTWNRQTDTAHPFGDAKGTPYETWQEAPKEAPAGASRYFKVVHL